ncbi:MAG: pyrroline-5-carboxylate reductase [Microthrixaceae bacterium]
MYALELLGGGRMGEALLGGLLDSGAVAPADVVVVEVDASRRSYLAERFPGVALEPAPVAAQAVVVATKPAQVPDAVAAAVSLGAIRVLSIAAGVRLETLEAAAGEGVAVVRAMPNTPALVGAGAAGLAGGAAADEATLDWAEGILGAVGTVVRTSEPLLDAVTGVSGSGPAYVFLIAEALTDAGVLQGLDRATSAALVTQTLLGAARLLDETGDTPEQLRAAVTSPAGTTAAGLRVLEQGALRATLIDAVAAAADRAREMG